MRKIFVTLILSGVVLTLCCHQAPNKDGSDNEKALVAMKPGSEEAQAGENASQAQPSKYQVLLKNPGEKERIEALLKEGAAQPQEVNLMLFYARKFLGQKYVGGTLDKDKEEGLVINTQELDCTTFVENVLALAICTKRGQTSFEDFCKALADIRYIGGEVAYTARQHYFTIWLDDNIKDGFLQEAKLPQPPLSATRTPHVDYMSTHVSAYNMLSAHPEWLPGIKALEQKVNKSKFQYIPKAQLEKSKRYKDCIHDGDIIGLVTNKPGLDISHVGFAVWHDDGLHLMHASSLKKEVIEDPLTLYQYLQRQKTGVGIRVANVK